MATSSRALARSALTPPQELVGQGISLKALTDDALGHNPGLQAKKNKYESLRSRVIDAWLPNDPMIGDDIEGQPSLFDFRNGMNQEYMVQQSIPFPTKLFLKGLIASKDAEIAYEEYKEEQRRVVWHIEDPYHELFLVKKTLEILKENQNLLEQFSKSAKARYESSLAPQADFLKSQIELSKNSIEIFNWQEKEHVQEAHLSHVLNRSLETAYTILDDEKPVT